MSSDTDLIVNEQLAIPRQELTYSTSRSSGPGGQNVNKVETRVTLRFDLDASRTLSATQAQRVRRRLPTRISRQGVLRVVSQRHRTQAANRKAAEARFVELLAAALAEPERRRSTAPPARAAAHRLEEKKRHSLLKRRRRKPELD